MNLVLKDKISKEDREELNDIFGKPMVIVSTLTSDSEESKAALAKMGIPEGMDPLAALSQMPAEALAAMKDQVGEKIDKMQESIITQAGVSYVRAEYEAIGEDVDAIQMDYMKVNRYPHGADGTGHHDGCSMCGISFIQSCCIYGT